MGSHGRSGGPELPDTSERDTRFDAANRTEGTLEISGLLTGWDGGDDADEKDLNATLVK